MGFAVNAARSAPDLHCLCGHCDVLPKNFDKPSIATEQAFCNSKGVHSSGKQCRRIYICYFCIAKILVGDTQPLELHPMDAGCAFLQNAFVVHQTCISLPEPLRFAAQLAIIKRERTFTEKRRKHHAYFGMDRKKQSCQSSSGSAVPCVGASV